MVKFIQLSDLHIHRSMKSSDNINAEKVIAYILNRYNGDEKPIVLITGDIVDDGKKKQYKNAVNILRPLLEHGFTVLPVPGNHDHGKFGNFYSKTSRNHFRNFILGDLLGLEVATDNNVKYCDIFPLTTIIDDVLFIGVDSSIGNFNDELAHFASGEVGEKQRNRIGAILTDEQNKDKKKVIYFHHHPFIRGNTLEGYTMELDDAAEVMQLIAGSIDVCCFGHKHKSEIWSSENNIDWVMASGKTTERNSNYKFQYREITINGNDNEVSKLTFSAD